MANSGQSHKGASSLKKRAMPTRTKCPCCSKYLSRRQILCHWKGQVQPHLNASQALHWVTLRKAKLGHQHLLLLSHPDLLEEDGLGIIEPSDMEEDGSMAEIEEGGGMGFQTGHSGLEDGSMAWEDSFGMDTLDASASGSSGLGFRVS